MSVQGSEGHVAIAQGAAAASLGGVSKTFGRGEHAVLAIDNVTLDVGFGEFLCLVGASGCGKSTILNLVAGLENPTSGTVEVRGGRTALMFQDAALFPWLTVGRNIELALRLRGVERRHWGETRDALLDLAHLSGLAHKRPHELSGGMRQRAALARSLAQQAEILLMDEPFGALDAMTRDRLHDELERLWRDTGLSVVFVTHNVREAVRLGDRVILLSSSPGRIAEEFFVDIPRPRRIDSPEVSALAARITDSLRFESA
ncbi:MAG: ABC transporter ATP-binding protein [Actinomycetota bacterium]|nr:ABC transporter ATP-binding protein [Actinomycetota bacterium]